MCSYSVLLFLCYLVASHPVTVENADLLVLLAGHVVQTLVSLHITDLSQTHRFIAWIYTHTVWSIQIQVLLVWASVPLPGSNNAEGSGSQGRCSPGTNWRVYTEAFASEQCETWCHRSLLWSHLDTQTHTHKKVKQNTACCHSPRVYKLYLNCVRIEQKNPTCWSEAAKRSKLLNRFFFFFFWKRTWNTVSCNTWAENDPTMTTTVPDEEQWRSIIFFI